MRDIDQDDLPESLADVVAAIGLSATLIIVERWGGIRIGIPPVDRLAGAL